MSLYLQQVTTAFTAAETSGARPAFAPVRAGGRVRVLLCAGLLAGLTGCNANKSQPLYTGMTRQVAVSEAFVVPPPGGPAVEAVLQTLHSNAMDQEIVLRTNAANTGQNAIYVKVYADIGGTFDPSTRRFRGQPPSMTQIVPEMRQRLPGVSMSLSPYFAQNAYGPFGYATGRAKSGATCLYGWQTIMQNAERPLLAPTQGAVDLRLRVCDAKASEEALLNIMYGLVVVGTVGERGWNPYGKPPSMDPAIGRTGTLIDPTVRPLYKPTTKPVPVAQSAPAVDRIVVERPAAPAKATYPTVPAPDPASVQTQAPASGTSGTEATGGPLVLVPPPGE